LPHHLVCVEKFTLPYLTFTITLENRRSKTTPASTRSGTDAFPPFQRRFRSWWDLVPPSQIKSVKRGAFKGRERRSDVGHTTAALLTRSGSCQWSCSPSRARRTASAPLLQCPPAPSDPSNLCCCHDRRRLRARASEPWLSWAIAVATQRCGRCRAAVRVRRRTRTAALPQWRAAWANWRSLSDLARRAHNPARAVSSGSSTSAAASGWTALSSASSWAPPGACGATCSLGASRRERASAFFKGRSRATLKIHSEIHSRGVHVFLFGFGVW